MIARLQQELDEIVGELRQSHPQLVIQTWSHSMGEANQLDGWSMGFTLTGLKYPIECDLYLARIHSKRPRCDRACAEWLRPDGPDLTIWEHEEGPIDLAQLRKDLHLAIRTGPVEEEVHNAFIFSTATQLEGPPVEIRESLSDDEKAVYQAWFDYLRRQRIHPLRLQASSWVTRSHPHSQTQVAALAAQMQPRPLMAEALVQALFSQSVIEPQLQGQGLAIDPDPAEIDAYQPKRWRHFYAQYPRAHGSMKLSPVGFHEDSAVVVVYNSNGDREDELPLGEVTTLLGQGGYQACFLRTGRHWRLHQLSRLPLDWIRTTTIEGELYLHFESRARFQVLARDYNQYGHRLHLQLQPDSAGPIELQVMDESYLTKKSQAGFDSPCPCVVIPYFAEDTVRRAVEKFYAQS